MLFAVIAVAFIVAGVVPLWEDGIAFGSAFLLVEYTVAVASRSSSFDRSAPLVATGLLALVDIASWSLELRDGAEERPFAHLRTLALLVLGALAASTLVLTIGATHAGGGLAIWLIGAAAALGLVALIGRTQTSR